MAMEMARTAHSSTRSMASTDIRVSTREPGLATSNFVVGYRKRKQDRRKPPKSR